MNVVVLIVNHHYYLIVVVIFIIYIVDGKGFQFTCKILDISNGCVETKIIEKKELINKLDCYIHIVIAPTKSSQRLEWFVEKAVEIGVDEISFIKCSD